MSDVLLATKIRIPPPHRNLVNRPHLVRRLNDGIAQGRRLTLICAPAGYGKSTLLSEWVSQLNLPVAWLSLEKNENTPARFWIYFLAALNTIPHLKQAGIGESMSQALQTPQSPPVDVLLVDLLNQFTYLEKGAVLVLDDLHSIIEGQILQDLVFLIDHLPLSANSLHLVVASRMDPPWPLARWRARGQLMEIRTTDLRFKPAEAAVFLNEVMRLDLTAGDVDALQNRTEGWIAGLQMTALSLQGRENAQEFIRAFTGSNRFIFDYLMEEILSRQEQDVQDFLLKTSLLERLSAPLCNAILGHSNSQLILDRLERTNLFLVSLDDERTWYRYHLLFADLLSSTLKQSQAEIVPELHRRACAWFEENGYLSEALVHALAANDLGRLAKLVERYAFTIMDVYEASSLLNWLDALPNRVTKSYPWLNIARAWLLAYLGRNNRIEQAIVEAEKSTDPGNQRLMGYIAAMRVLNGEFGILPIPEGISQARMALELLPPDEFRPRAFVSYHLANILAWYGDTAAALKMLEEATALSLSAGDLEMAMTAQFENANILRHTGKLKESSRMFERTFQMAGKRTTRGKGFPIGFAYLQQAQLYLDWNEMDKALDLARKGIRLCKSWGYSDYLYNGWSFYSGILLEAGDLDGALSAVQEAKCAITAVSPGGRISALEAMIHQVRGDWTSVDAWLSSCGISAADSPDFTHRFEYFSLARILEERGKLDEASRIFEGLRFVVEKAGINNLLLRILTQEAMVADKLGDDEKAFTYLQRALQLAEPEGYIRAFVNKGKKMEQLLRKAMTTNVCADYARMLLGECAKSTSIAPTEKIPPGLTHDKAKDYFLIETLSDRELEVLHLLNTSMDSTEIAAELRISVSTVRTHIKNIYSKLDVNRRMQAVERAYALKLL